MTRGACGVVATRVGRLADSFGADGLRAMTEAAAFTVKTEAVRRVVLTIGGDRRMSQFGSRRSKGRVRAGVGYDYTGRGVAVVGYRPAGMWALLEDGARAHPIGAGRRTASGGWARRRGQQRPLLLVAGHVVTGPVRHPGTTPKRVITRATRDAEPRIPDAVERAVADLVAAAFQD